MNNDVMQTSKRGRKPFVEDHFNQFLEVNKKTLRGVNDPSEAFDIYATWAGRQHSDKTISESTFSRLFKSTFTLIDKPASVSQPQHHTRAYRLSLVEQFDMLEQYIKIMANNNINSLFIYGLPGIGKTETVCQTLNGLKAAGKISYKYCNGGIKDAYSLAKLLYENKDGKIIVFDDFDSLFRNKNCVDIMKAALQDHSSRTITWADSTKRSKKDSVPREFTFTSACIFISNRAKLDPAIKNRSMIVHIDAEKIECLEWVKLHFNTFMPKLPAQYKETVYDFVKSNIGHFKSMDYRVFKKALCDFLVCQDRGLEDGYWKKVILQNSGF